MKFVIATKDYAGLGFAIRLQDEGYETLVACNPDPAEMLDIQTRCAYELVGNNLVKKCALAAVLGNREKLRDAYWIWDHNHSVEENELLRREGFKVLGGGQYADGVENDRAACLALTSTYGLESPASFPFTDLSLAVEFCEEHASTAYVYKPATGANFETFVPESEDASDANQELRLHLASLETPTSFILQERKEGVEAKVEVWFQQGEPVFAFMTLACRKKYVLDLGPMVGCAFDFAFTIPLESKAVTESVGRLFPAYKKMKYTGFGDANFIAARDGVWFFEKCERFGYNAHPNLFLNLSLRGVGEVLASLVDGNFKPCFSGGFGSSVLMSTKEHPAGGKLIQFPQKLWPDIFFWDVYKKDDLCLTAGYDQEGCVLLVNGYGYTMPTAWESAMKKAAAIKFPCRHFRTDGANTDYPSSPIRRYEALKAMGYI
jgi:phosphoribosylamine--glycine ligase